MSRHVQHGLYLTGNGKRIAAGTTSVFLAGTTTAASIYAASSGGAAVNSVLTGDDGMFTFYVDTDDYTSAQLFKIVMSKTNYKTQTIDNQPIIPGVSIPHGAIQVGKTTDNSQAITCTALDTWYPIAHASLTWTEKSDDGVTNSLAAGKLIAPTSGDWKATANISFKGSNNNILPRFAFLVNGSKEADAYMGKNKLAASGDVKSVGLFDDLHGLTKDDEIQIGVMLKTGEGGNTAGWTVTTETIIFFVEAVFV